MASRGTDGVGEEVWQDLVTHDGVFAVDSRQHITYWSKSAERILGYRAADVVGRFCHDVVAGRDSRNRRFCRRNCPVMANARRGRGTPDYDVLCALSSGEEKWLNVTVAVPRRRRSDWRVIHLFRDVSHRRRIEEFAKKVSSALGQLLSEDQDAPLAAADPNPVPPPKLSRRESEVLRLLAAGMSTQQIAHSLAIQRVTARNHITRVLGKLGVENRLQAVIYASERRLI